MVRIGDMEEDHVVDGKPDSEQYAMDDADAKKDAMHDDEPTEHAPLKSADNSTELTPLGSSGRDAKENDISGGGEGGAGQRKGGRLWFAKSRAKWWVAVAVGLVLLAAVLVVSLLTLDLYRAEETAEVYRDDAQRVMRLWPRPNGPNNLIHFRHGSLPSEGRVWPELTSQLERLMEGYKPELLATSPYLRQCYVSAAPEGSSCYFDIHGIAPACTQTHNFGYDQGKPCVFLRFANVTGWKPEPYTSLDDLTNQGLVPESARRNYNSKLAFIHCRGNTQVDEENMGPVDYFPEPGYRLYFFPYENQTDYMPPLVAVRFKQPAVGIAIGITCTIWARNLNYTEDAVPNPNIHFNLLIE